MKKIKKLSYIIAVIIVAALLLLIFKPIKNKKNNIEVSNNDIEIYHISQDNINQLATTEVERRTTKDEESMEKQEVDNENFKEEGDIVYNGSTELPKVSLGDYVGLTYYSQIDNRWKNHPYTSTNNESQTIGSSGCGPTSAAMVVTAIKGTITPDTMGDLFVKYGYRSSNNGTYFSALKWTADVFNIGYQEVSNLDDAINLLNNNYYVIASCGSGLFTYEGHYIVLTGISGNNISIYDPYLYSGKFDTPSRAGKATVIGNTVYCSIKNFRNSASATHFFCFKHDESNNNTNTNPNTLNTEPYVQYVKVNTYLNIRDSIWGDITGKLYNNDKVTVYETSGDWSRIGENKWVNSAYLTDNTVVSNTKYVKVNTYLNIRDSIWGNITGKLYNNDKVTVYETSDNWSRIGKNMWVNSDYLSDGSNSVNNNGYVLGLYEVTASKVNVRSGPGINYKIKKQYSYGTKFDTYKIENNWAKTPSGWVCLDYTKIVKTY